MTGTLERFAAERLAERERAGLLRQPDDGGRRAAAMAAARAASMPFIDASSNDYLGLANEDVSRETDVQGSAVGAGAARLIHGTRDAHVALERAVASWVQLPAALLFTTGYTANVGLLSSLGQAGSVVVSDRLNHASLIDGCRLGRAQVVITDHLDAAAVEASLIEHRRARARWVVVESCFSMDGDGPDLRVLRALCDEHDAGLIVDEAHSLGVWGPGGGGRCAEAGVVPDALVGTLGKAVGTQGAFVAGSERLRTFLWNEARSFVFSTATSPRLAQLSLLHVERTRSADHLRAKLAHHGRELRIALRDRGLPTSPGLDGPIVPLVIGGNDEVLRVVAELERSGILAQGIRPPTVPPGTARLRFTACAAWPDGAGTRVAEAVRAALPDR